MVKVVTGSSIADGLYGSPDSDMLPFGLAPSSPRLPGALMANGVFVPKDFGIAVGPTIAADASVAQPGALTTGGEVLVNTNTGAQQSSSWNAGLTGGRHVITWIDYSDGATVKAQLFDATGAKVGGEIKVNTSQQAGQWMLPVVTGLANGNFVVTWHDNSGRLGDTDGNAQLAQIFNANGVKVGVEFRVNTATAGVQEWGKITALTGGGFVVAWEDTSGQYGDADQYGVVAQIYSYNGTKQGGPFLANTTTTGIQSYQSITGLKDGGFVITWHDDSGTMGDTSGNAVKAQVFTASGGKVGGEFIVNQATAGEQRNPMISTLDNGDFVITWRDASGEGGDNVPYSIKARIFAADGTARGDEFLVNTIIAGSQSLPTVTGLVGGGFVVTWQDGSLSPSDASGWAIRAQVFDNAGNAVGEEFLVPTSITGSQQSPAVAATANGGFVISWDDYGNNPGDTTGGAVRAQLFGRAGLTLDGNSGNDDLTGSALHDVINGYAGNDVLVGGAGDDILTGAEGDDDLTGGDGNDRLYGGTGADRMTGGLGDDVYYVDNAGDVVVEGANAGKDTIYASVSYSLNGRFIEDLILQGSANLDATGNSQANRLTGNGGDNILDGLGGADIMIGKGGNDIYYVDHADDVVTEAVNGGIDEMRTTLITDFLQQNVENLTGLLSTGQTLYGNSLNNHIIGGAGDDNLFGLGGNDIMEGGLGNDLYRVADVGDVVIEAANAGIDTVGTSLATYTLGDNLENLSGVSLGQVLIGNALDNEITANTGNDTLDGREGADRMAGGRGDDIYYVDNAGDNVVEAGGSGNDMIYSSVSYNLLGRFVETLVLTGSDNISAVGNTQLNTLVGNSGNNVLRGGLGNDLLTGGAGADIFAFDTALGETNIDRITDFSVADDTIRLSRAVFEAVGANGVLAADAFRSGTRALDADDRILYNSATGALFYDADGNGAGAAVQFARLSAGLSMTHSDFLIVA